MEENISLDHKLHGTVEIPRLILGTSPFIGAGQFGARAKDYYIRFALNPSNITKLIVEAAQMGITWIQALGYDFIVKAIEDARAITNIDINVIGSIGTHNFEKELYLMKRLEAKIILTHALVTDKLDDRFNNYLDKIESIAICGAVTHKPGDVIPLLSENDKVKIIMASINTVGKFMLPSPGKTIQAMKASKKIIIGKKTLAAGYLKPKGALEYVKDFVYGITIGIASSEELEETFNIAKQIYSTSPNQTPFQ